MQDVVIEIKSIQEVDGDSDSIELTTVGKMNTIGGKTYLKYEDSAASGIEGVSCLIKVDPKENSVVMQRSGVLNSRMYIKEGQRHICHYETGQGTLVLGVFGETVEDKLTQNGGSIYMSYTLDVNYGMVSRNKVKINVKQA
ncbi:MAG: DUF1934 domain-containing protein [Clostridia bacterium]|nr:DUF1934 domain-containing protein [Clostridia bacterium]